MAAITLSVSIKWFFYHITLAGDFLGTAVDRKFIWAGRNGGMDSMEYQPQCERLENIKGTKSYSQPQKLVLWLSRLLTAINS